jgi:YidC/Oxa1 family membrane protein insertase
MDEKRAIVAVVLIFIVWFVFTQFQGRQAQQAALQDIEKVESGEVTAEGTVPETSGTPGAKETGPKEESSTGAALPASGSAAGVGAEERAAASAEAREEEPVAVEAPEKLITVTSPLWTAEISSRGGAIASWRLTKYDERLEDAPATPVDLVAPEGRGLSLSIGYGTSLVDTDQWAFDYNGPDRVELGEGRESASLKFSSTRSDGMTVVREYVFDANSYAFRLSVQVAGLNEPTARRDLWIGWPGVQPTDAKEDRKTAASVARVDGGVDRQDYGAFAKEEKELPRVGSIEWITTQSRYFMVAVLPVDADFSEALSVGGPEIQSVGFRAALPIEGERISQTFEVFAGPQDYSRVSGLGIGLERAIYLGYPWVRPLSVILLRAMVWTYRYIRNYGLVIILFSILTKLAFYRLTHKSFTEMKRMQDVQPKMNALKEQYGDDKEALAKAQMELYRKEGVNPLGSCLPMILQMPVFFALYQVLRTTIELRGAPFMLWITDLSQPDTIATVAGFPIHVLPLLMGLAMLAQQRFTSSDPTQAGIGKMMPILFTALFYSFSSGLVIYWLVNTVLSVGQQYYIHRGSQAAEAVSSDQAAPDGVRKRALTSAVSAPEIPEAEVVSDAGDRSKTQARPSSGSKSGRGRGGKRRRKKK